VHRNSHAYWLSSDPAYREAFIDAHEAYCDQIRDEIRKRAIEGDGEPVFNRDGEFVATRKKKSDLLLIFEAKARMPHLYRDNAPLPATPGPDVADKLKHLTDAQLDALIAAVERGETPQLPEPAEG
jgi:hypothetical protein